MPKKRNKTKNDIKEYSHYDLPAKSETPQVPTETTVPQTDKTEIVSENTSETYNDSSDIKTDNPVLKADALEEKYPDADIIITNGGQPVYYFIISVE